MVEVEEDKILPAARRAGSTHSAAALKASGGRF